MRASYTLLAVAFFVSGCSFPPDWPPHWNEIVHELNSKEFALLDLEAAMREDDLSFLADQHTFDIQVVSPARLGPKLRSKYRPLFEAAGPLIWAVQRDETRTRFQIELDHQADLYHRFEIHHQDETKNDPACDPKLRSRPCGYCTEVVREGWLLSYFWIERSTGRQGANGGQGRSFEELDRLWEENVSSCLSDFRSTFSDR